MKRILVMVMVVLVALTGLRAESYRDLLKAYLNYSGELNEMNMQEQLADALTRVVPAENATAVAGVVSEYATTQMVEDLVDVMQPYFEKHVSDTDLREMIKTYQDERYQQLHKQAQQLLGNLQNDQEYLRFMEKFQQDMGVIVQGNAVEDLKVPASINEAYQKAFKQYYVQSGVGEILDNSFNAVTGMVRQELVNQGIPDAEKRAEETGAYLIRNMEKLTMVIFSRVYSADDLNYMTQMADTEAGRHCMKAAKDMTGNPFALIGSMMQKMSTWLDAHHPEYGEKMQQVLQILKGFGN